MQITITDQPFTHNCGEWCNQPKRIPVRTATMSDAERRVIQIEIDGYGDASLSNGLVRSSKEVTAYEDGTFGVWHGIDDTYTYFTRAGLLDVFNGKRDIWDGDIDEEGDQI